MYLPIMHHVNFFRFEKRIYIPLPELNERASMFKKHLGTDIPNTIKENEWMQLAEKSKRLVIKLDQMKMNSFLLSAIPVLILVLFVAKHYSDLFDDFSQELILKKFVLD